MNQHYTLKKQNALIEIQLLSDSKTLLISVYDTLSSKPLLCQQQFPFEQIKQNNEFICNTWQQFCEAIKYLAEHSPDNICFESEGTVVFRYSVNVLGNTIGRQMSFKLKNRLQIQEEVKILRQKVVTCEGQMRQLQKQVARLKLQNTEISARVSCLEQMSLRKGEQAKSQARKQSIEETIQITKKPEQSDKKQPEALEQGQIKQEHIKLNLDIDPNALYYSKFKIQDNKITSLFEDYYQVYWKDPLPKKGTAKTYFKMTAKNHFSVGIISESQKNNQYSFQNNNSVCLYTYYQGYFRGLYVRGKYFPLEWSINVNEIIEVEINLTKGTMTMGLAKSKHAQEIDIADLQNGQNLYFFLQMYEKDNSLVFLYE